MEELLQHDLPVFARGATPVGPLHRGPGEINYPICCGGVVVHPGDIMVADGGGIVVLPYAHAEEVLKRLVEYLERSADYRQNLKQGNFSNAWVDDVLAGLGWSLAE